MSIKTWFNKLTGKEEEVVFTIDEAIPDLPPEPIVPPPVVEVTHKRAIEMKHGREAKPLLIDAFYGTLVDRTPEESNPVNRHKKKHAHDGWRDGFSHPFEFQGRTYDVQKHRDDSREQFEELMAKIEAMEGDG